MKKEELLHMHGLLCEVQKAIADDAAIETPEYDAHDAGPSSIHQSKQAHEDAVFALADDITTYTESTETHAEPPSPPAE